MSKAMTKLNDTTMAQTTMIQKKDECQTIISNIADDMLDVLEHAIEVRDKSEGEYNSIDSIVERLDMKIVTLLGRGETVIRKVRKGISLSPFDVDYITMNLKIIPYTMEDEPIP